MLGSGAAAQAAPSIAAESQFNTPSATQDRATEITAGLKFITSVPDSVLAKGDRATSAWLKANAPVSQQINIFGCAGAIAVAIAGVAFPAAKILKIKKLLNQLGGITKAVKLLWGASFNYEKVQAVGGALAALGAELFGIASVKDQYFS